MIAIHREGSSHPTAPVPEWAIATSRTRAVRPWRWAKARHSSCIPITEAGSGSVQEKEEALLNEIIENVNDLF